MILESVVLDPMTWSLAKLATLFRVFSPTRTSMGPVEEQVGRLKPVFFCSGISF